jgi:hypothetical protein
MKALILLAVLSVAGCATIPGDTYVEVGVGINTSIGNSARPWDDAGTGGFYGALRQEWQQSPRLSTFCKYAHYSQWLEGSPFNDTTESSLDHFGCGTRFRLGN